MSLIKEKTLALTTYTDYFLFILYKYFLDFTYLNHIQLLPNTLHYFFILYFIILLLLFRVVSRLAFYNRTSRSQIIRKLKFLNDIIDSSVNQDSSFELGFIHMNPKISRKKTNSYQKADVREIEKRLIEIIDEIGYLPVYSFKASFIIIFDELDKIETYADPQIKNENGEDSENTQTPDSIRKRLNCVMILLSNLKYFLSTAQAKFIFIAGRELYDASLADVSDRNFRLGSIFHDTLYLNSFFTDLDAFGFEDITSRTEQYVCRYLFPENYPVEHYNLKEYNTYLLKYFDDFNEDKFDCFSEKETARKKREKIIYLLQQFITYLNHISAGAPSKITTYFENYVITKNSVDNFGKNNGLLAGNGKQTHYLFFDFIHQYKIGVFDYLLTPFNFSINRVIKNYGDKLIISATFLFDHLLKFHRNAFSWRDLEATPEMLDVNKNPELRDFLGTVMDYMLKTHIQEIVNGLYEFKFPKKVSQEINYLSHVSEEASAIFNFTLDESSSIKQHYLNKLNKLEKENTKHENGKSNYQFAKNSLFHTIGDICFYDEDLGDAMVNYLVALNDLRNLDIQYLSITQMALLTRNMLKLGHTLEKRRTYDVAILTYNEISEKISKYIELRNKWSNNWLGDALDNVKYFYQPILAKFHLIEKTSLDGITNHDIFILKKEFEKLYQSIDYKTNIYVEFWNKAGDILYYKNISYCINDHKCRMILELKNDNNDNNYNKSICIACKYYYDGLQKLLGNQNLTGDGINSESSDLDKIKKCLDKYNQHELNVLAMTLSDLGDVFLSCANQENMLNIDLLNDYNVNQDKFLKSLINRQIKNKLDKMLVYYHFSAEFYRKSGDEKSFSYQYVKILYFIKEYIKKDDLKTNEDYKQIVRKYVDLIAEKAINGLYQAYNLIHSVEISRFKNIFTNDKEYFVTKEVSLNRGSINAETDEIVILYQKIKLRLNNEVGDISCPITPYGINNNMYNRFLKLKLKAETNKKYIDKIIDIDEVDIFESLLQRVEDKELREDIITNILLQYENKNKYTLYGKETDVQDAIEFCITDSIFCYYEMLKIFNTFGLSFHHNYSTLAEIHEKLYIWSEFYEIYCILYTFSNIDDINNVQLREKKIENGPVLIRKYKNIALKTIYLNKKETIKTKLEKLIEPDNLPSLSIVYHCEKAAHAYQAAIETHKNGRAYHELLENMYYLNDDYNDKLYHFSIGLERFKINSDKYETRIIELKKRLEKSTVYKAENYTTTYGTKNY
jgi:hypothetical protein